MSVDPTRELTTMNIVVGSPISDFGYIDLAKGGNDDEFNAIGKNSAEFELLFANEAIRSRMEKAVQRESLYHPMVCGLVLIATVILWIVGSGI